MSVRPLARAISMAGHPFVLVPGAILATGTRGPVLYAVLATMAVITVQVVRGLVRGDITDVDVSERRQRPRLFLLGIASAAIACAALFLTHQSPLAVRGSAIALGLLVAAAIVNRWMKVSLHCLFAAFAAGIASRASFEAGAAFAIVALLVAWARVAHERHSPRETAVGLCLGALGAFGFALG